MHVDIPWTWRQRRLPAGESFLVVNLHALFGTANEPVWKL